MARRRGGTMGSAAIVEAASRARHLAAAIAVASALVATTARAEGCPLPAGADARLASMAPERRVAFVMRTLEDQARRARTWSWAWAGIGAAISAESFVYAGLTSDKDARADSLVSGTVALALPISSLALRLDVEADMPRLRALYDATDGGRVATCLVLERAEELLENDARDERLNAGWLGQASAVVVNGALALILGVGLGHWRSAATNGIGGLVLSEIQIFTQPTGAVRAWDRYRAGDVARDAASWTFAPAAARGGPSIGATLSF